MLHEAIASGRRFRRNREEWSTKADMVGSMRSIEDVDAWMADDWEVEKRRWTLCVAKDGTAHIESDDKDSDCERAVGMMGKWSGSKRVVVVEEP